MDHTVLYAQSRSISCCCSRSSGLASRLISGEIQGIKAAAAAAVAAVRHAVADAGVAADTGAFVADDGDDAQIWAVVEGEFDEVGGSGGIVAARAAIFLNLLAAAAEPGPY